MGNKAIMGLLLNPYPGDNTAWIVKPFTGSFASGGQHRISDDVEKIKDPAPANGRRGRRKKVWKFAVEETPTFGSWLNNASLSVDQKTQLIKVASRIRDVQFDKKSDIYYRVIDALMEMPSTVTLRSLHLDETRGWVEFPSTPKLFMIRTSVEGHGEIPVALFCNNVDPDKILRGTNTTDLLLTNGTHVHVKELTDSGTYIRLGQKKWMNSKEPIVRWSIDNLCENRASLNKRDINEDMIVNHIGSIEAFNLELRNAMLRDHFDSDVNTLIVFIRMRKEKIEYMACRPQNCWCAGATGGDYRISYKMW
jgi:hypothetical protein